MSEIMNRSPMATAAPILQRVSWGAMATAAALAMTCLPARAQELLRTISVSGEGSVAIAATEARVQLGVEVRGKSADAVQAAVAEKANAVVAYLKGQSVEQLQTSSLALNPIYSNDGREVTGYVGSNIVSFQVPVNRAGIIVDNAVRAGATRIDSLQTLASDSAIESARSQALAAAAIDAREQADVVLSALGLSAREVVQINVAGAALPRPIFAENVRALADRSAPSPVEGGEQVVQANVTLQIRY